MPHTRFVDLSTARGKVTVGCWVILAAALVLGALLPPHPSTPTAAPEARAPAQAASASPLPPSQQAESEAAKPLTKEEKLENVQATFATLKGFIEITVGAHDMAEGKIQMDLRAGEIKSAREWAHMLVDQMQKAQTNVFEVASKLQDDPDLNPDLAEEVSTTANTLMSDFSSSAAGIASITDFGMGENSSDIQAATQDLKALKAAMLAVYKAYGYSPKQVDLSTWRLKKTAVPAQSAASDGSR